MRPFCFSVKSVIAAFTQVNGTFAVLGTSFEDEFGSALAASPVAEVRGTWAFTNRGRPAVVSQNAIRTATREFEGRLRIRSTEELLWNQCKTALKVDE